MKISAISKAVAIARRWLGQIALIVVVVVDPRPAAEIATPLWPTVRLSRLPGCACKRSRPERRLTAVTPLPIRNCLRVQVLRVNAVSIGSFRFSELKTRHASLIDKNVVSRGRNGANLLHQATPRPRLNRFPP